MDSLASYIKRTLYSYQKKWLGDKSRFRIVNKSRQIGFSFVLGIDIIIGALLRERNQLVISSSLDNATIIGDYVREHLEAMGIPVETDTADKIKFFNGKKIRFLATNWRTARGFNGDIWFDEFAFTLQDSKMWTALVPSVTAVGGRISVVSTPKSRIDKFWQLWEKSNSFSKHNVTIHDAVSAGFPVKIEELRELFSPEEFAQAYECIPLDTSDSYIAYDLIEPCIDLSLREVKWSAGEYQRETDLGNGLDSEGCLIDRYWGVDIGRTKDETAIVGVSRRGDSPVEVRNIRELKRQSFGNQKEHLSIVCGLPHSAAMGIDRGGIGMNLHEDIQSMYPSLVRGYNFAPAVKERLAKLLKRLFEERRIRIPNHSGLIQQILSVKRSANKTNIFSYDTEDKTHHADKFWALAIACDLSSNSRVIDYVGMF
ncbi:MAG: terminase family protein [Candidatus Cloacimonadaceae bacterium]|nr:terminase family protein [Candidatus Cloacimonadaceae bacterium]